MKIILCDTNIVFPIFARIIQGQEISHSSIFRLAVKHEVYISPTILYELEINLFEQLNIVLLDSHIETFVSMSGIYISDIYTLDTNLIRYVNDPDDAQILQDAVSIHADFLLSRNIKDFDIASIQQDLHIHIIGYIPDFLLE